MADIKWNPPEVKRGRTYDDKKFFTSLKNQKETGKSLSEKQIRALMDLLGKYAANIPDFEALKKQISEQAGFTPDVQEDTQTTQANQDNVRKVLEEFAKITQWAEPVKKGRRVYDDKEFVKSLSDQAQKGKILSERQVAALLAMAAKYQINVN